MSEETEDRRQRLSQSRASLETGAESTGLPLSRARERGAGGTQSGFEKALQGTSASNVERPTSNAVDPRFQDPRVIRKIYGYMRTIAMVGLSPNRLRPSFFVAQYLQYRGYRVIPVNPAATQILGETAYPSLLDIPFNVDVVDVFRAPAAAPAIAEEAVKIGARALWMQFGVVSPEAAERAAAAGLDVVMDKCMKIEHGRFFGEMHWFGLNTGIVTARRPARVRIGE